MKTNGWTFSKVDIMDEDGTAYLPVKGAKHIPQISVGSHMLNYDSMLVLTHFKGHVVGGFGGSLKNIGIGCADGKIGKEQVHHHIATGDWPGKEPFMERMLFAPLRYMKSERTNLTRKIPVGLIYTMNCPENLAKQINYDMILGTDEKACKMIFGYSEVLNSYDTYQFTDYSKYDCDMFDEVHKKEMLETQFPKDLEKAFDLGKRLTELKLD